MVSKCLKFSSEYCPPCKALAGILKDFDRCPIEEIDAPSNQDLCEKYGVRNVPTLIFVDESGNEIFRHLGMTTLEKLNAEFDANN